MDPLRRLRDDRNQSSTRRKQIQSIGLLSGLANCEPITDLPLSVELEGNNFRKIRNLATFMSFAI